MDWTIILVIALLYTPVLYRLSRRISNLEKEVAELKHNKLK